jgi:putative thioredoxin
VTQSSFNPYGAVDLSALARQPSSPSGGGQAAGGATAGAYVVDVGEADFQSLIEQSMTVPVVIDFWADWCGPCKQLSPVLEKLAQEAGGSWLLAKIDVDANQRIGAAFQVQSIPAVFAVLKGQPVPLFQGALPEAQVRQYLDELLRVAAENGVTGRLEAAQQEAPAEEEEPAEDPRYDQAYDAIERGDYAAAAAAYRSILESAPDDADARAGLGQVELLQRTAGLDEAAVRAAAEQRPDDVDVQCQVADLDLLSGASDEAFRRLIEVVRRTSGPDRDRARTHLVGLFDLVGPDDPHVAKARTALANALF